jgi:PTH1 family peptidyl-tRNA hydrolase
MVIDELAGTLGIKTREFSKKLGAEVVRAVHQKLRLILVKPQTFMNLSGQSVVSLLHYYKIPLANLIVIHDDIDLESGRLKIKIGGGTAGHNGLNSIVESLGDKDFIRVRLGIGRGVPGAVKEFVLEKFSADEFKLLEPVIESAAQSVLALVDHGLEFAMNRFNS